MQYYSSLNKNNNLQQIEIKEKLIIKALMEINDIILNLGPGPQLKHSSYNILLYGD